MKKKILTVFLGLAALAVLAQYSIDWSTRDGGGGTSSGGVFTVSGTIGQPDAGTLTGGNITLQGGFWGVVMAVQTEGAPWLTITHTNAGVLVSWPAPATGFVLEQTPALSGAATRWHAISTDQYQTNGSNLTFTILPPIGNQCFRLHKP